ncbi:MAG: malate dehydrogenase [Chthonomonadales bacterium]|nr:malate dehydrogenase [Chthonomonadales bacterium]
MYLTDKKVAVMGAAGAIGSNLVQDLLSTGTASVIAMYDPFASGLEGAAEEIYHCAYPGARVAWTTDPGEALEGASYVISSGGAPRKEGMTREDLLRGNCEIARDLGRSIRQHAPDAELVVVIFNPADITGLTTLVYSGLKPGYVSTLAALDSTRLQTRLAQHFGVAQDVVAGCATYGGHGEKMAVFKAGIRVAGVALTDILAGATANGRSLTAETWAAIQDNVRSGGARIIKLRGRSSYQSPSHQSVQMLRARIQGSDYPWPCGAYFADGPYRGVMMAADARFTAEGIVGSVPRGSEDDMAALRESYEHLCALRDEVVAAGILPPPGEWRTLNPNL